MLIHPGNKPLKLLQRHDSSAELFYTFYLKPPAWTATTETIEGDIIAPTSATGFYYQATSSGVTGATEPTWATVKNGETADNTVKYKAINNTGYLTPGATLTTATVTASDSVPVANIAFTSAGDVTAKVGPIPAGVSSFVLSVHFTADTGHAVAETDEYSTVIKVTEQ